MKFYYIVVILFGIMLLLNLGGLHTPLTGSILNTFGITQNNNGELTNATLEGFQSSDAFSGDSQGIPGLKYILLAFAGAGLVLGAFGRSPDIRYITAVWIWGLVGYLTSDIIGLWLFITSISEEWMKTIATLLLGSLLIALYIAAVSFWQGTDG